MDLTSPMEVKTIEIPIAYPTRQTIRNDPECLCQRVEFIKRFGDQTYRGGFMMDYNNLPAEHISQIINQQCERFDRRFEEEVKDKMVAWAEPNYISTGSATTSSYTISYNGYVETTCFGDPYRTYTATSATSSLATSTYTLHTSSNPQYLTICCEDGVIYYGDYLIDRKSLSHYEKMQNRIDYEWRKLLNEERLAEERERRIIRARARDAAEDKALLLLESFIGEEELAKYRETGHIYVKGKNGLYLAKKGGGISKIEGNRIIDFCVHLDRKYNCPPTDDVVAMKFLLENDDNKIIQIANRMGEREVKELPIAACM